MSDHLERSVANRGGGRVTAEERPRFVEGEKGVPQEGVHSAFAASPDSRRPRPRREVSSSGYVVHRLQASAQGIIVLPRRFSRHH